MDGADLIIHVGLLLFLWYIYDEVKDIKRILKGEVDRETRHEFSKNLLEEPVSKKDKWIKRISVTIYVLLIIAYLIYRNI